jgi:hypothetical protein
MTDTVTILTTSAIASLESRIAEHQLQSSELSDRCFADSGYNKGDRILQYLSQKKGVKREG